jgi:hypothetical protein
MGPQGDLTDATANGAQRTAKCQKQMFLLALRVMRTDI